MQSLNKIHINGSTKISLSDRFSILQSAAPAAFKAGAAPAKIAGRRNSRSRSRSRAINYTGAAQPQVQPAVNAKTSIRNRNLLAQLDQKQKMRAALKIKRVRLTHTVERKFGNVWIMIYEMKWQQQIDVLANLTSMLLQPVSRICVGWS